MGISAGDTVVLIVPGAIGLLSMQLVKAFGGQINLIGTSRDGEQLEKAAEPRAIRTVDIDEEDPYKIVHDITDGRGAYIAIECSVAPQAVEMDFNLARKQGKYLQAALLDRGNPV